MLMNWFKFKFLFSSLLAIPRNMHMRFGHMLAADQMIERKKVNINSTNALIVLMFTKYIVHTDYDILCKFHNFMSKRSRVINI